MSTRSLSQTTPLPTLRLVLQRLGSTLVALLMFVGLTGPAHALSSTDITVTSLAPGGQVLLPNDSNNSCNSGPKAATIAYRFTNNTSSTINNLSVEASVPITSVPANASGTFGFLNIVVEVNPPGPPKQVFSIGSLGAGKSKTLFWLMQYPCWAGTTGNYTQSTATLRLTVNDQVTTPLVSNQSIATQKAASAQAGGAVFSQPVLGAGAIVGQIISYTVTYTFGNIGNGDYINVQPVGNTAFNNACFQLVSSKVTSSGIGGVVPGSAATTDTLDFLSTGQGGSGNLLTVVYSYLYRCANTTTTATPYAISRSGQILKYDASAYGTMTMAFKTASNPYTISKTASTTQFANGGGSVTYTVTIKNTDLSYDGYIDSITDILPSSPASAIYGGITADSGVTTANSSAWPAPNATGTIKFVGIPTTSYFIPRGSSIVLKYTVTIPNTLGYYVNSATAQVGQETVYTTLGGNTPASVTVQNGTPGLLLTKTHANFTASPSGGTGTYTLTAKNTGNLATKGNLTLTDNLPNGLTLASFSGTGWSCAGSTAVTCAFTPTLAAGASTILTLNVNLPTGITTNIVNNASLSGGGTDANGNPLTATAQDTVSTANLTLAKTASVSVSPLNSNVTYTLKLTNVGPSAATGVIVEDVLPSGAQYVNADSTVTCVTTSSPVVCTWAPSSVAASATVTATITVKMIADGTVTNSAQVKSSPNTFDPNSTPGNGTGNSEDDTSTVTVAVGTADVSITKTATSIVLPGGTVAYTLAVSNTGPSAAANVVITDVLPGSVTYQSWSVNPNGQGGTFSNSSGTLSWTHVSLPSGTTLTYTVLVTAPGASAVKSGTTSVQNTATVSTTTFDPASVNNSSSGTTRMAYVELIKVVRNVTKSLPAGGAYSRSDGTAGNAMVPTAPGDVMEYCIDFRNYGAVTAANFTITDLVPANTATLAGSGTYTLNGGSSQALPAGAVGSTGLSFTVPGTLSNGQYGRVCFQVKVNS